jgi:bifunctional DNA-binding transcriptional regulator/antitoxin component of YhaV-PrlF toxin-antitoxin module
MSRLFIARVSPKGQITIPARCLRELGWVKSQIRLTRSKARGALVVAPINASAEVLDP